MWTLIILSHILMFCSFVTLMISAIQGHFFHPEIGEIKLQNFSIFSVLIYVFTQTLILFLIITISKEINSLIVKNEVSIEAKSYKKYKRKMHIHTSLNLFFIMTLAILFAAVHQQIITETIHRLFFIIAIIHYGYTIKIQYYCFKKISELIVRLNDIIITKL